MLSAAKTGARVGALRWNLPLHSSMKRSKKWGEKGTSLNCAVNFATAPEGFVALDLQKTARVRLSPFIVV